MAAATGCCCGVHSCEMGRDVERDKGGEGEGGLGAEEVRENEKEASSGGAIDQHVENSAELCGLVQRAGGVAVNGVENKAGCVEEQTERRIVEGDGVRPKSDNDTEVADNVGYKEPDLPRSEGSHLLILKLIISFSFNDKSTLVVVSVLKSIS